MSYKIISRDDCLGVQLTWYVVVRAAILRSIVL